MAEKHISLPDGRMLVLREDYEELFSEFRVKEPRCTEMFYHIVSHMNDSNRFTARVKDLSEALGVSTATTARRIRKLRESGLLHTEISEGRTCFVIDERRCFVVD